MEQLLGMLIARLDACDINLFPFNGHVVRFEYCLNRLGYLSANAIT